MFGSIAEKTRLEARVVLLTVIPVKNSVLPGAGGPRAPRAACALGSQLPDVCEVKAGHSCAFQ